MALPKPYRLRDRKEFDRVYRRGKRCGGQALLLRIASQTKTITAPSKSISLKSSSAAPPPDSPRPGKPVQPSASDSHPSRIAVVVSTKVHKRAVVRNRVRRQIQAACQTLLPQLKSGQLIVITVKASAVECDYCKFLQQLKQLLVKAEVLHGH